MATSTVTIDKVYFETLLRRAQFHTADNESTTPSCVPTVAIQKTEHDSLLITARQYANLRRNLFRGGITDETLAVLTQDEMPAGYTTLTAEDTVTEDGAPLTQAPQSISSYHRIGNSTQHCITKESHSYVPRGLRPQNNDTPQSYSVNSEGVCTPDGPSDGVYDRENGNNEAIIRPPRQQYSKFAKRTILINNLPEGITHSDIVDAVRGGLILEIYLRLYDRTACVSFLEETRANEFFRYVMRNDLYIRGKRVTIRWSDRQFILPGYVANKISIGATRNLVIHKRNPKHTEDVIREDLEHIHNLVVIKVTFNGSDVHISTNSVHNALFARTCMMSRAKYKGCRIDWDQDECASPLEPRRQSLRFNGAQKKTAGAPQMNRFQLLNLDGADDNSQEGDGHNLKVDTVESSMLTSAVGVVA